jgi:hypothetical protein
MDGVSGGRHELRHYLRPATLDDWREYERNLRSTVETMESDGEETLKFDSCALEAAARLYDRLFRRAEGYQTSLDSAIGTRDSESGIRNSESSRSQQGSNPPLARPESRVASPESRVTADRIPLHHKELVVRGLSDVAPAAEHLTDEWDAVPFALDAETMEVRLEARRAGATHSNLLHVFRPPSAADRVEHSRIHAQALYVRGSRGEGLKSLLPSRLPGLVALYDRLILEACGYAAAGRPLADRAAVVRHMDPLHKKVAVQVLFEE